MYTDSDPRVIEVLDTALRSSSRTVRLRAVCMLANVTCARRRDWLAAAYLDGDPAVRQAASIVISWTLDVETPPWPQREDPSFDRVAPLADPETLLDAGVGLAMGMGVCRRGVACRRDARRRVPLHDLSGRRRTRQEDRAGTGRPRERGALGRPLRAGDGRGVHRRAAAGALRRSSARQEADGMEG